MAIFGRRATTAPTSHFAFPLLAWQKAVSSGSVEQTRCLLLDVVMRIAESAAEDESGLSSSVGENGRTALHHALAQG